MTRGIEILLLMDELRKMPEYRLHLELQSLDQSIYIFDKNFNELALFLNFLANDSRADSLFWMRNLDKLRQASREVIRFIHNYVASALSLIDHTRRLYNKLYREKNRFPEYLHHVQNKFADDPLSCFVQDLRRYCQHYKSPSIAFLTRSENLSAGVTRSVELSLEGLQEFTDWSSLGKKYISSLDSGADVLHIASTYRNKVIEFYNWFRQRQLEIHEKEFERFREKETRLLLLELEDKLDLALFNEDYRRGRRDSIFVGTLTSQELDALEKIPPHSSKRPEMAITCLEEYLPISNELKEKIYRLYTFPDLFDRTDTTKNEKDDDKSYT